MLDPKNQSPPLSPRTATLYAMMNNRFEALQRRIDQIRIEGESRDHEHRKRRRRRRERHDDGDPRVEDHGERSKEKKVKVAASEFKEYTMVWWDQYKKDRRRCGAKLIDTWEDMKDVMRRRYAPNSYKKGNPNKLQSRPKFIQKKFEQSDFSKELKKDIPQILKPIEEFDNIEPILDPPKIHLGPRSSLIKQDEGKIKERDIKGGFVRRVFDPGSLART
ncbi:hypothetical protein Lal_00033869 [Lupinus albus]|nr:hypothetical protein Lal_00033869 [Lupinus albus]